MKTKETILLPKHALLMQEMGQNIKLARKRRHLTTEQVSERASIHRTTLYRVEKGDSSVAIGIYFNVLRTLNLHLDLIKVAEDDVFGRKLQDLELLGLGEKDNTDKLGELKNKISNQLHVALARGSFSKTSILNGVIGCTFQEFKEHLESNKYGFLIGGQNIDVDHIIPISKAKSEEDVKKLNHYLNLQLLPSYYNRTIKSDKKWDEEEFNRWFQTF